MYAIRSYYEISDLEKLSKELDEERIKYLRLMAEYDNFRKRSAKEKLESYSDATAKAICDLLVITSYSIHYTKLYDTVYM